MIKTTNKEILQRRDLLPEVLLDAIYSDERGMIMEKISSDFHLSLEKSDQLEKICLAVFYGFVHLEDVYKEIRDQLQIDSRLALEIYGQLDKGVFSPIKKEIEDNFLRFRNKIVSQNEIQEPMEIKKEIVLKKDDGVINLKEMGSPIVFNLKQNEPVKPIGSASTNFSAEAKEQPRTVNVPISKISQQPPKTEEPKIEKKEESVQVGPVIIHKMGETQSISELKPNERFRQSFGGFGGSFATLSKKTDEPTYKARVDFGPVDGADTPLSAFNKQVSKDIPISVKKYGEEPKVVHYGGFKTETVNKPIEQKKDDKKIDLSNFQIKE